MYKQSNHFNTKSYQYSTGHRKAPVRLGKIQTDGGFQDVYIYEDKERVPLM